MKDLPLSELVPEINPQQMTMLRGYFRDDDLLRETILRFLMVREGRTDFDQLLDEYRNNNALHSLVETAISYYNSKQSERME